MDDKKYTLECNGIQLKTNYWMPISDEEYAKARHDYFDLPPFEDVIGQLKNISSGGTKVNLITHYYFRDLMSKVKLRYNKWTMEEVYNCKQLIEHLACKCAQNTKVYPEDWSLHRKLFKCFGLAGKGVASPPTQFSLSTVDSVLSKYNVNGNYYDFSCGWGIRLLGALRNKVSYVGTDPNDLLCERLKKLDADYRSILPDLESTTDIRCTGSEKFVPEWENKIGVAFSSPPYFDVEDYKIGEQSYRPGMEYIDWIRSYVIPTMINIKKYLVDNGYFIFNIKDTKEHKMAQDWVNLAKKIGFEFIGTDEVEVHKRSYGTTNGKGENHTHNGNENMFIFMKKGNK